MRLFIAFFLQENIEGKKYCYTVQIVSRFGIGNQKDSNRGACVTCCAHFVAKGDQQRSKILWQALKHANFVLQPHFERAITKIQTGAVRDITAEEITAVSTLRLQLETKRMNQSKEDPRFWHVLKKRRRHFEQEIQQRSSASCISALFSRPPIFLNHLFYWLALLSTIAAADFHGWVLKPNCSAHEKVFLRHCIF